MNLGILEGSEVVYIIRIKRHKILGINLYVGSRSSAYNSAICQALAYIDSERLESILKELSQNPESSLQIGPQGASVKKKLDQVRENGYALCDGEYVAGLRSIGVPIFKGQGEVEGVINIPVFSQFCSSEKLINNYLPLLQDVAKTISSLRGWHSSTEGTGDSVGGLVNQF